MWCVSPAPVGRRGQRGGRRGPQRTGEHGRHSAAAGLSSRWANTHTHTHTHTHTYAHTYAHTVQHKAQLMLGCCPTYSRSVFGSDLWKLNYHLLLNYTGRKSVEGSSEGRDEWIKAAVTNHLITALTIQVSQPVQPFLQKHRIVLWMTHRPEEWGNERVNWILR